MTAGQVSRSRQLEPLSVMHCERLFCDSEMISSAKFYDLKFNLQSEKDFDL
jgi:hypothetical protein